MNRLDRRKGTLHVTNYLFIVLCRVDRYYYMHGFIERSKYLWPTLMKA